MKLNDVKIDPQLFTSKLNSSSELKVRTLTGNDLLLFFLRNGVIFGCCRAGTTSVDKMVDKPHSAHYGSIVRKWIWAMIIEYIATERGFATARWHWQATLYFLGLGTPRIDQPRTLQVMPHPHTLCFLLPCYTKPSHTAMHLRSLSKTTNHTLGGISRAAKLKF